MKWQFRVSSEKWQLMQSYQKDLGVEVILEVDTNAIWYGKV